MKYKILKLEKISLKYLLDVHYSETTNVSMLMQTCNLKENLEGMKNVIDEQQRQQVLGGCLYLAAERITLKLHV